MFDINSLISAGGLLVIGLIIFGESGLMIGFFFPGDTLLISAGVFAASGKLSLAAVIAVAAVAAVVGDNTGYHIGRLAGPKLLKKEERSLLKREHVEKAEAFFKKYGARAMLIAHFIPIVRTFLPVVAGAGKMPRRKFILFDAVGDCAWAVAITLLGYYVGSKVPGLDRYILIIVAAAVICSFTPVLWRLVASRKKKRQTKAPQSPNQSE